MEQKEKKVENVVEDGDGAKKALVDGISGSFCTEGTIVSNLPDCLSQIQSSQQVDWSSSDMVFSEPEFKTFCRRVV